MDIWNEAGFWDGGGGAIVGAVLSFAAALLVLYGTRRHDERMANRARSLDVATDLFERTGRWQARMQKCAAHLRVFRQIDPQVRRQTDVEESRNVVRQVEKLVDEIADALMARSMQLDELRLRARLERFARGFLLHSGTLFSGATVSDKFDPYAPAVVDEVEEASASLDGVVSVLRDYLTVRPTRRELLIERIELGRRRMQRSRS